MGNYDHLDRDALVRLLERRDAERQLGLVWERDELDADRAINDDYVALRLDADLSHGEASWDNLIIEGDNFDALRALRMSHKGAIDCIYIDPPYNTGNRDFVYNDRFVDKNHRFRHSLWLEFMYRRLLLARELLADHGVIFVSIDDNELFRLGMLMDQVFGVANKLVCFVWQTDGNFDNQAKIKISHEYVLAYAADADRFPAPQIIDPNIEEGSKLFRSEIRNTIVKNGPKNPVSEITLPSGFPASFGSGVISARQDKWPQFDVDIHVENGCVVAPVVVRSGWANRALCEAFIRNACSAVEDSKGQKTTFELTENGAIENVKKRGVPSHVVSVLRNMGNTQNDSRTLQRMDVRFTYPKPVSMVQYLLSLVGDHDGTVLDFFAGSGTTAHAVARLNAEDGGQRKFILVSNTEATEDEPDKNLCRDVCAERVRRVMTGYRDRKGEAVPGLGGGFAYLRSRRIARHRLAIGIEHAEIWHALQLLHRQPLQPWSADTGFARSGEMAYLADFEPQHLDGLRQAMAEAGAGQPVTLYSWAPERLREDFPGATLAPIPDFLAARLGA